jgi:hypothetical protein
MVRFAMMKKAHKGLEWAEASLKSIVISPADPLNALRRRRLIGKRCCGM